MRSRMWGKMHRNSGNGRNRRWNYRYRMGRMRNMVILSMGWWRWHSERRIMIGRERRWVRKRTRKRRMIVCAKTWVRRNIRQVKHVRRRFVM